MQNLSPKTFIEQTVDYHRECDRKIVEKLDRAYNAYKRGIESRSDRRGEQKAELDQAMEDFQSFAAAFYSNEDRYLEPEIKVFHSYDVVNRCIEKDAIVIKINGVCYRAQLNKQLTVMSKGEETVGPVLSRPENWLVDGQESITQECGLSLKDFTLYCVKVGVPGDTGVPRLRFNIEGVAYQLHKDSGGPVIV